MTIGDSSKIVKVTKCHGTDPREKPEAARGGGSAVWKAACLGWHLEWLWLSALLDSSRLTRNAKALGSFLTILSVSYVPHYPREGSRANQTQQGQSFPKVIPESLSEAGHRQPQMTRSDAR